jgi:predicted DsbA family dithiol-disulfide isomerase
LLFKGFVWQYGLTWGKGNTSILLIYTRSIINKLKIEIWSDVACPYCYIGLKHLENAIKQYAGEVPELILRSFELEPEIPTDSGETQYLTMIRQYNQSCLRAKQTLDAISNAGREAELKIDLDKVIRTNTFHAHRLIHFAGENGRAMEMQSRLFQAYFKEGQHIGKKNVLTKLAAEVGIDSKEVMKSDLYAAEVRADEHKSQHMAINAVPFFLFEEKYSISGAQPPATFIGLMKRLSSPGLPAQTS